MVCFLFGIRVFFAGLVVGGEFIYGCVYECWRKDSTQKQFVKPTCRVNYVWNFGAYRNRRDAKRKIY